MAKSKLRLTLSAVCAVVLLTVSVFLAGRYGWRLFGFALCDSAVIESVDVTETGVRICGSEAGLSSDGCIGYRAKLEGDVLYVGVNFSAVFGIFETSDFDISIPTDVKVSEVYLVTSDGKRQIYKSQDFDAGGNVR